LLTTVADQPGCNVLAVSTVKPAGGVMFAEARVVLLDVSFVSVTVKSWWLTSFVTATWIV
jgi:hypothetical protein